MTTTAQKVPDFRVFSGPYFLAFGSNTEIYRFNIRIQLEKLKQAQKKTARSDT